MKVLVFLIITVMPNGSYEVTSNVVQTCPNKAEVNRVMDAQIANGDILSWQALCEMMIIPFTAS